ncbi:MAG: efflux RND transporter periplasmic adaptor subunit [Gemmatimonadetes bacterium]|nr:efflux RND transporter periplasmic adaptor subunit [Gemmatimonadota bacterium]
MIDSADLSKLRIRRGEPRPGRTLAVPPRRLGAIALLLAVAAVGAFILTREPVLEVRVVRAEAAPSGAGAAGGLTANGYIVARTKASVSSKVPGRLAYLGVDEGDRVRAGQVIARLEAAEYEAAIQRADAEVLTAEAARMEAEARLVQARRELERARALHAEALVSVQAVQDAETGVAAAEAQLRAAEARIAAAQAGRAAAVANLESTLIRAPFDGTVLRKDAELGEVVAPAVAGGGLTRGAVVTMADLSTLEVEVDVNEAYIAQVRHGQPARIILDAYPGEEFPGHVRQVVPTADRQRATVLVRVAMDSRDPRILSEMGARVVFSEEAAPAAAGQAAARAPLFVPDSAVTLRGGRDVVWLVDGGRARLTEVDAGPVSAGRREIRRGLSGGELLIVNPPLTLADGARVRVVAAGS